MSDTNRNLLKWIPRILAIMFLLFMSLFALDVFSEDYSIWETLIALFMHLIPSYFLIAVIIIAWRWSTIGGILFLLLGTFSVFFFNTYRDPISFMIISLPAFILGALFIWDNMTSDD